MVRTTSGDLDRLQRWYQSQCNGAWEHQHGVRIDTLDNPGWMLMVDLSGTDLAEGWSGELEREERSESDWFTCRVVARRFEGFGGAGNLGDLIRSFLRYVDWS